MLSVLLPLLYRLVNLLDGIFRRGQDIACPQPCFLAFTHDQALVPGSTRRLPTCPSNVIAKCMSPSAMWHMIAHCPFQSSTNAVT